MDDIHQPYSNLMFHISAKLFRNTNIMPMSDVFETKNIVIGQSERKKNIFLTCQKKNKNKKQMEQNIYYIYHFTHKQNI